MRLKNSAYYEGKRAARRVSFGLRGRLFASVSGGGSVGSLFGRFEGYQCSGLGLGMGNYERPPPVGPPVGLGRGSRGR